MPSAGSLRSRLIWAGCAVLAVLILSGGLAVSTAFVRSVEQGVEGRLRVQALALFGQLDYRSLQQGPGSEAQISVPVLIEPRLEQPSSDLFAYIRNDQGEMLWRSPSLLGQDVQDDHAAETIGGTHFGRHPFLDHDSYRFSMRVVWVDEANVETELEAIIVEFADATDAAVATFRRWLWFGASLASLLLLAAGWVGLNIALTPFNTLEKELAAVESGTAEQLRGSYPSELASVVSHLNRFVSFERGARVRYRQALDDLAHSLKTPLAVLRNVFHGDDRLAVHDEQLHRMEHIVSHQLERAMPVAAPLRSTRVPVKALLERLSGALTKVYGERSVELVIDVPDTAYVMADERDVMEVLGNLLDNAFKYCASHIEVYLSDDCERQGDEVVSLVIDNDGWQLDAVALDALTQRGVRGDEQRSGQGIGLAMCSDILRRYNGSLQWHRSRTQGTALSVNFS